MEARAADLLETVEYCHAVFTLPHKLALVALQNKEVVYNLLFRSVSETLKTIARDPKRLGAEIGFLAILHTWGQTLRHHTHIHCLPVGPRPGCHPWWRPLTRWPEVDPLSEGLLLAGAPARPGVVFQRKVDKRGDGKSCGSLLEG